MSVPRLMVESALCGVETPTHRKRTVAELFEVRTHVATVANNVNQLARSANISGQVDAGRRLEETLGEVDELLIRMRELTAELSGATFTVSNLGMFGMSAIRPIINPPQAANLGVGAVQRTRAAAAAAARSSSGPR